MISMTWKKVRMPLVKRVVAVKKIAPANPSGTKENPPEVERGKPVMMRAMKDEEETTEQEFQKATDAMCIDGGASLRASHHQLKQWVSVSKLADLG